MVGTEVCGPSYLIPEEVPDSRLTFSDAPFDDCELDLRGIAGLLLDAEEATKVVGFFLFFIIGPLLLSSRIVEVLESLELTLSAAASRFKTVLDSVSVSVAISSSASESGGDANRAVGRGPEAEGPLGFFRIGCGALTEVVEGLTFAFKAGLPEPCEDLSPAMVCAPWGRGAEDPGEGCVVLDQPMSWLRMDGMPTHGFISVQRAT